MRQAVEAAVPSLTILCHPDPGRVGERVVLTHLLAGETLRLSRLEPSFSALQGGSPRPLDEVHLSRKPFHLSLAADDTVALDTTPTQTSIEVDNQPLAGPRRLNREELGRGVVLLLGGRVVLLLRTAKPAVKASFADELLGESAAMVVVRRQVPGLAVLDTPVLLRGEAGTCKEVVARAIHDAGPRRGEPFIAAAIDPARLPGLLERAVGGTLFLDGIDQVSPQAQSLLLSLLEAGEVRSVKGVLQRPDVRFVFAAGSAGSGPLLDRLSSQTLFLPPLRERREDFGRLFFHFLYQELQAAGDAELLRPASAGACPWVPAELVSRLATREWPGNGRQLRDVVRELVTASRGELRLRIPAGLEPTI